MTRGLDDRDGRSLLSLLAPRYWHYWLILAMLRSIALLPYRVQLGIGRALGFLVRKTMRRGRRIAQRNLQLCFPELSSDERARLLERHLSAVGMSVVDMAIGWFMPMGRLRRLVKITGQEHLERAIAQDRGVLLFAAHSTTLEVGAAMLQDLCEKCAGMYRPQRNPVIDRLVRRGRRRFLEELIPRDDIRRLVKLLRSGYVVIYMPDQTYLGNQSAVLPFFAEPAVTNTATTKLAAMSGAVVLTYFYRRLEGAAGYQLDIGPPLPGIPSDNAVDDTRRLFAALERHIRLAPEQYLWTYKKFKRRPAPLGDPYSGA
jgi:KDO2-lipid IV(A) lauroyltransferase